MSDCVELGDGRWRLVVAPALGGSLATCEYDGQAVLQPSAQPASTNRAAMRCGLFPLIPFSNRIEHGRFTFDGRPVRLEPNVAGSPHAMHGHGWQSAWRVLERGPGRCTLVFERLATAEWPWAYRGTQNFLVADGELCITLAIENLGDDVMPCGLGFHPFFPRGARTRLAFEAARVFDAPAAAFPTGRHAADGLRDFRSGPCVADREGIDHCFEGWRGAAIVHDDPPARAFRLEGCKQTRFVIVYIPAGADYFCVEPVTHAVNAVNHPANTDSGLWTLGGRRGPSDRVEAAPGIGRQLTRLAAATSAYQRPDSLTVRR